LRKVLFADAAISGATGLLMVAGADFLGALLEVPTPLLNYAGLSLLPWAVLVGYLATRQRLGRPIVWTDFCNLLWAANCIVLLLSGWVGPNGLGYAFIIAQAVVVVILAELQYVGMRKSVRAVT
jgi:hypothetical protein